MMSVYLILLILTEVSFLHIHGNNEVELFQNAIDLDLYEKILDAEECHRQVRFIRSNSFLRLQFADAGIRAPRGILTGNNVDLGNYHQCLGINHQLPDMDIQGKYCSIMVPFNQSFQFPQSQDMQQFTGLNPDLLNLDEETISKRDRYELQRKLMLVLTGQSDILDNSRTRVMQKSILSAIIFRLGVCVPKPCTTEQALTSLLFNLTAIGFDYTEDFCRVPNDKPRVAADTCFVVIFSIIGFLTILSTLYDVSVKFIWKKDSKEINPYHLSFSLYSNGKRLMTFSSASGSLSCIDGIRTIAMMWVIVGHSFSTELFIANPWDGTMWLFSAQALWIVASTITVDTFFTLGGILLVYSSAGKMSRINFLKNLHWFYVNRLVRIYPLLATTVLLQASYLNRMTDGPFFWNVATQTNRCRELWWSTLLNVQNFLHPNDMCLPHSWYVAIDLQLYLISPLILYWVFTGNKRNAWIALLTGLIAVLTASTTYNFIQNLQSGTIVPTRPDEMLDFMRLYYFNTLTRASPFFVGMMFGYLLHSCRGKKVKIPWYVVIMLWFCTAATVGTILYCKYIITQFDWDNQLVDNLINSFMRPAWGAAVCWLIFACVHGYSGPMNWFLSLDVWRLPARISYGMYLIHYQLMFAINAAEVAPVYFTVAKFTFKYLSHQVLALAASFVLTLLIDAPCSYLFKIIMDTVQKKRKPVAVARDNGVKNEEKPDNVISIEVQRDEHKTQ